MTKTAEEFELMYVGSGDELNFLENSKKDIEAKIESIKKKRDEKKKAEKKPEKTYSIGDRIEIFDCHRWDTYILSQVASDKYGLISIENGNRWTEPVKKKKGHELTKSFVDKLVNSGTGNDVWREKK